MATSFNNRNPEHVAEQMPSRAADTTADPIHRALAARVLEIGRHCASLPNVHSPGAEETISYDETGLWR